MLFNRPQEEDMFLLHARRTARPSSPFFCQNIYPAKGSDVGFDVLDSMILIPTKLNLQIYVMILSFLSSIRMSALTACTEPRYSGFLDSPFSNFQSRVHRFRLTKRGTAFSTSTLNYRNKLSLSGRCCINRCVLRNF